MENQPAKTFPLIGLIVVIIITLFSGAFLGSFLSTSYPDWSARIGLLPKTTSTSKTAAPISQKVITTDQESAVIHVVEESSPAVVSVLTKEVGFDPETGVVEKDQGIGTGFIIDKGGIIITNAHVVSDTNTEYTVVTKDKKSYPVTKIDRDIANDIAILKVNGSNLPTLVFGDATALKAGQSVVAIGNALGKFDNSVTTGVVSQMGRTVTAASDPYGSQVETLENVIQTDAALNPGNSGGPLLNLTGEVVGVNVATTSNAQNIGFAIPINTVKDIYQGYQKNGRILKPYLGVNHQIIVGSDRVPSGALVRAVVPGSPAEKAGIQSRDIITQVGDTKIGLENSLAGAIAKYKVGDSVDIKVWRDEQDLSLRATLAEVPQDTPQ